MTTYTIPAVAKDELQKKLERLQKKANAYGNKLEWSFGEEKAVDRNVYSVDSDTHTQVFTDKEKVFGIEINIESDIIRKDGYTVIAQKEYEVTPVYDWKAWNEEDGEFQDADGNTIDGIIGYEVA